MRAARRAAIRAALALVVAVGAGALLAAAGPGTAATASGPVATDTAAAVDGAPAPDGGDRPITVTVPEGGEGGAGQVANAQLRWGLNREASSGSFAGGCNFLSAGAAGDAGGARVWGADDGLYAAESGDVRIEKATASGTWRTADFATRCLDPSGAPVSAGSLTASTSSQVVIDGGVGEVGPGGARIRWSGSFTVAFYGGMTYWTATDPTLTVAPDGTGRLVATLGGYGTSMDDLTKWEPLPAREVVLAELRGVDLGTAGGFTAQPEYLGVRSGDPGQVAPSAVNEAYWGSFPADFVAFQQLTGQASYWFSSGGQRDPAKPATPLIVNYDATAPAIVPPAPPAPNGADPSNTPVARPPAAPSAGGAAPAAGAPAAALPAATALTAARDEPGLVPDALTDPEGLLLPLGALALAVLVSTLCVLQLAGRLPLPWGRGAQAGVEAAGAAARAAPGPAASGAAAGAADSRPSTATR
ncbi:hypothetical protein [Herbiconiux sp. VKM Ac-2851]|uniref:hypothetical protein n=1 Tax=Herbiconiux sp. VKM Ac-2851 TaxID=2739025 RepID=UPI001564A633|nr:hypothetical protein [Herbiconiux sp. VKM Ac-2851]NQX34446.1 hypothetical protein [Herbiconiux sp. VKM Ac-2851]